MAYFIFQKNSDDLDGTIYKIAENESDLNNLNIFKNEYKIIEDSIENFNYVKNGIKFPKKYINNTIVYEDISIIFKHKETLETFINNFQRILKYFLDNNQTHPHFERYNNYYNQLNNLNLNLITYPLNKSLEKYFIDLGQPSFNILQIP
jgi:hypothetical protein